LIRSGYRCHCEERSDEAIQVFNDLDCFASLAMTLMFGNLSLIRSY